MAMARFKTRGPALGLMPMAPDMSPPSSQQLTRRFYQNWIVSRSSPFVAN